jgi:lipoprotein-anchoring transpeptidase ErfK/SrfK
MAIKTTMVAFWKLLIFSTLLVITISIRVYAASYLIPSNGSDIIGALQVITIKRGDTFQQLGMTYGITPHELEAANPQIANPTRLRVGQTLIIPSLFILPKYHDGIVINLSELRLYYFDNTNGIVYTYPISAGRAGWRTPTANTYVTRKKENPTWYVPKSIYEYTLQTKGIELPPFIGPGPRNPLGHYGIYLAKRGYLIHGTNAPQQIGLYISSGCIRMYNHDVEELYNMVNIKTPVHIVHHPEKVGFKNNQLYLEVHEALYLNEEPNHLNTTITKDVIQEAEEKHIHLYDIDWGIVNLVTEQKQGIPIIISKDTSA